MKYKNLFKKIGIIVIILVIMVLGYKFIMNGDQKINQNNTEFVDTKILGNADDLVDFSILPGSKVSGVMVLTGSVKGGYFFEANILVNILDYNKKLLKSGYGNAKTNWMTVEPVGFETVLDFTKLPKGPAFIEIHNDNPAGPGEGIEKSILIPIVIE